MMKNYKKTAIAALLSGGMLVGCANNTQTGALVGGLGGAAVGGAIGSMSHQRAGEGALIGAAVGAIGGGLIGHGMDENEKKEAKEREHDEREYRETRDPGPSHSGVNVDDVVAWSNRGTRDDVIIDRITRSGTVFHLTASDMNYLRDKGVSENVINAMRDTERR